MKVKITIQEIIMNFDITKPLGITKESFVEILTCMKKRNSHIKKLENALSEIITPMASITVSDDLDDAIIKLLTKLTGDADDEIDWWLSTDDENKLIYLSPKTLLNASEHYCTLNVSKAEDFYDYLLILNNVSVD